MDEESKELTHPPDEVNGSEEKRYPKWKPKHLLPRHRQIMRLKMIGSLQNKEIAEIMNLTEVAVSYIINSDIFKAEMAKLQREADEKLLDRVVNVKEKFTELSQYAVNEIEKLVKAADIPKKLKADLCFDILEYGGYKPSEKREILVEYTTAAVNAYEARKLREMEAREQAQFAALQIEAESIESDLTPPTPRGDDAPTTPPPQPPQPPDEEEDE